MIEKPYLLFLADAADLNTAKTAYGVAYWRPDDCLGELAFPECAATTGQPRMSIAEAAERGARTLVVGVATSGGALEPRWIDTLREALENGLDIASGMHGRLKDHPELRALANRLGRELHDVRSPPPGIQVGTGRPRPGKRVLTVGTDCSVGKMFTALAVEREMHRRGVKATFRATGQTGILIAGAGIAVDAVVADFISGAAERLAPANDPDHWDVIEGQGSLFHPSFAGVSLGLLHGAAPDRMVMCHDPTRRRMRGDVDLELPDLRECIRVTETLARLTNPEAAVVGVCMNTNKLDDDAARDVIHRVEDEVGLPACDPVRTDVTAVVDGVLR